MQSCNTCWIVGALAMAALPAPLAAEPVRPHVFDVVPLGVEGGIEEGATTAWFIAPRGGGAGLTCDAGTLVPGIRAAIDKGGFPAGTKASTVLHERIRAYLVTHPHLDHVAGLVMASPDDVAKPIFALPEVNAALAQDYFNWSAWPNMADRGKPPFLRRYGYRDLTPGVPAVRVEGTGMTVSAYPLSHGGALSTAFLIEAKGDALLCMGDTGPDAVEKSSRLGALWQAIAPLVRQRRLRAIIVETSYPNARRDEDLFGHLTPRWLNAELERLAKEVGDRSLMNGLPIVIGHIKPSIDGSDEAARTIAGELNDQPSAGVKYIIGQQGRRLGF
ncbi:3',5'-cyclic-nucleotide phosphodiesterase [Novosphingobium gossypii]